VKPGQQRSGCLSLSSVKLTVVCLQHVHEAFYAGHDTGMRGTTAEEQMAGDGRDVKAILSEVRHSCWLL
jgi:hypothetical protein